MTYQQWLKNNFDKFNDFALITGATSGIGLEYLRLLAIEGCNCIILSNETERLNEVAAEFSEKYNVKIEPIYCDLANYDEVVGLEPKLAQYRIKILINNAGFGLKGDFLKLTKEQYKDIVAVNSLAPTLISHMVLPGMREMNCGLHISVATINVATPIPGNTVYTATKFYVWAYALALSAENQDYNITFQVMLPGTTDTAFHVKQGTKPQAMTMQPDIVAKRSLNHLDSLVYIPNTLDRLTFPLAMFLPIKLKMKIAKYAVKKRLGV